jgi:2-polyprenyl-6-hydroxyphenyl methylase/3-demethylubiquinone-9 3-methyltransferase
MSSHSDEVQRGERYQFGENWRRFLEVLDEDRIREAERSLQQMLGVTDLAGKRFLDAGSGSGIMSLAARRLGARVHSFDFDPQSVACTAELRRRYSDEHEWHVEEASVLDAAYLRSLGTFDVVYSWGVLHHTGKMWDALDNITLPVGPGGTLFIAIYNDQGTKSRLWKHVKRVYCSGPAGRAAVSAVFVPAFALEGLAVDLAHRTSPLARYRDSQRTRGMSVVRDWFDWLGGYPFEVARPEQIFELYRDKGYTLERLVTGGSGCNQFVFTRRAESAAISSAC